ncbi:hypothetical protein LTR70_002016 [Exophiala xenobiotica]|uniref:SUN domain-containing protein n=1 Tax=Lithohypha guttulata TaxID=1690604 RepID=A0ABR0KA37_9EURO|nr:hypothetical protein LTR24_005057 [Lithohypha guttulata]KAK5326252.1 hypothetical protein LTR70_002016 [Exophiala xenobiotica]
MRAIALALLQQLLLASTVFAVQDTTFPTSVPTSSSLCPARTVNYITQSLPQQCLATDRATDAITRDPQANSTDKTGADTEQVSATASTSIPPLSSDPATETTLASTTAPVPASSYSPSNTVFSSLSRSTGTDEPAPVPEVPEEESALESGNFLSFEEWKKQNLKKAGQSEHVGRRNQPDSRELRNRPDRVQNSLESLGDDGEIDLDFSGFVPGGPEQPARELSSPLTGTSSDQIQDEVVSPPPVLARSKDAGSTSKGRFNYASFDCAANVLEWNKEAESPKTVLVENKDSYMLNRCSAQSKFIVLELCNDILIDTVVLANFEFFSSTFRTFRVSVSDRYPVKVEKWRTIGTYEARNTRQVQAFLVHDPVIWARWLRIDFLSHYGNEYYCPVSLVRVHGTTMMEDYRKDLELAMDDDVDETGQQSQDEGVTFDAHAREVVAEPLKFSTHTNDLATREAPVGAETPPKSDSGVENLQDERRGTQDASTAFPACLTAIEAMMSVIDSTETCSRVETPTEAQLTEGATGHEASSYNKEPTPALSASTPFTTTVTDDSQSVPPPVNMTMTRLEADHRGNMTGYTLSSSTMESSYQSSNSPMTMSQADGSKNIISASGHDSSKIKSSSSTTDRLKSSTSIQAQQAAPTMQDSFFKSVQKRLQMLETNSSMSLQYVEDQSRALRDAFKKVEQRQLSRTNTFLDQLNQTVLNELREFRQQYDQLWQSTVIELELQRERYERDNQAINTRIGILADEVIFQRRLAILQMILILVCLVLVLFSRGAINNYLELPIVQNVLAKSPSSRWLNLSGDSPNRPAQPLRARSAHVLRSDRSGILKGHRRMHSEDWVTDTQSGPEVYAPPTPVSEYGQSEVELSGNDTQTTKLDSGKHDSKRDDPEFDPSSIERPATSPPTLRINGGSPVVDMNETSEEESIDRKIVPKANSMSNSLESPSIANGCESLSVKHLSWKLPES